MSGKIRFTVIAGACAVALLAAGCSAGADATGDPSPAALPGFDDRSADFVAVATTQDGASDVAVLTGSAARGEGAGEFTLTGTTAQPNHVLFHASGTTAAVSLPGGGRIELTPESSGRITGSGTVVNAAGAEVPVHLTGSWSARLDEQIPNSTKCGNLDEKLLLVGDPAGDVVTALERKLQPISLDLPLTELAIHYPDFDAVVVNPQATGALTSPVVRTFLQGSKWVVVVDPGQASKQDLQVLLPAYAKNIWDDSWAVAVRAGDPGAAWNQDYHTVPLRKAAANKQQPPTAEELDAFLKELDDRGDTCTAGSAGGGASAGSAAPVNQGNPSQAQN